MRNPALPKLLRAIGNISDNHREGKYVIYEQAAIELEKLEKMYILCSHTDVVIDEIRNILNDWRNSQTWY